MTQLIVIETVKKLSQHTLSHPMCSDILIVKDKKSNRNVNRGTNNLLIQLDGTGAFFSSTVLFTSTSNLCNCTKKNKKIVSHKLVHYTCRYMYMYT